jgi:pyruvate dehydrogenase E1 component beta subunit
LSLSEAINEALDIALAADSRVFLLGEDIADPASLFPISKGLSTKYGADRVRNTPISEQAIIGAAIGAAIAGMRPVAEIMLFDFVAVCLDQLYNHAGKLRYMSGGKTPVPMTVRTSAGAGGRAAAQHSDMLEGLLAHMPGLKVVVASTPADAKGLLLSCIFDDEDPCIFVEQYLGYFAGKAAVPEGDYRVPIGVGAVRRPGSDATIVTYGRQVLDALKAADELQSAGIDTEVIDLRTISPWDRQLVLDSVARTKRAVIVHEAVRQHGPGAEIAATIMEELFGELAAPVRRIGAPFTPVPYAKVLEDAYIPRVAAMTAAIKEVCDA